MVKLFAKYLVPIKATTGPFAISLAITTPSAFSTKTAGIVQIAPLSPGAIFTNPASLFIIMTALAPACSAYNIFKPNWQVFLQITAIFPVKSLMSGKQPS